MALRQIGRISAAGAGGSIDLLQSNLGDAHFAVDHAQIRIDVTFANASGGDLVLDPETFFGGSRITWQRRDGKPWLQALSLIALELWAQKVMSGRYGALVRCVDTTVANGGGVKSFYFDVPLRRPLAARPEDFVQSLASLGALNFLNVGQTGTVGLTITNTVVTVSVSGAKRKFIAMGSRNLVTTTPSTASAADVVPANGAPALNLCLFTKNLSGNPIFASDVEVKGDNSHVVLDLPLQDILEANKILGQPYFGDIGNPLSQTQARAVVLLSERPDFDIADLPRFQNFNIALGQQGATAGDQFYLLEVMSGMSCNSAKSIIPNGALLSDADVQRQTELPKLAPGVVAEWLTKYLPRKFYPNDGTGLTSGGGCGG